MQYSADSRTNREYAVATFPSGKVMCQSIVPSEALPFTRNPTSTAPAGVAIIALPFRTPLNPWVHRGRFMGSEMYRKAFSGVVLIRTDSTLNESILSSLLWGCLHLEPPAIRSVTREFANFLGRLPDRTEHLKVIRHPVSRGEKGLDSGLYSRV